MPRSAGPTAPSRRVAAARGVRRRELFRTAAADLIGSYGTDEQPGRAADHGALVDRVGRAVSDLNAATLAGALRAAVRDKLGRRPARPASPSSAWAASAGTSSATAPTPTCCSSTSRARASTSRRPRAAAHAVANEMRRLLQLPTTDPPLLIDADLRPEGKSGPLVRTLASYAAYYRRWSLVWESQALLRAEPVAGDGELGARFIELIDPLRYPAEGLGEDAVREIRRLKARMEAERLPRGADPTLTPSSAAAACPTWSGPSSCCRCGTAGRSRGCARPAPGRRWPPHAPPG